MLNPKEQQKVEAWVLSALEQGKTQAKSLIPVETGKARSTIRIEKVPSQSQETCYRLVAGGIKEVDYAHDIEYNHKAYLRPVVEAIARHIEKGKAG